MGRLAIVCATVVTASSLAVAPARAGSECFNDWSEARAVVKQHGLVTVETLLKQAPGRFGGEVVRTTLCRDGDRYFYRLVVREPSGTIRQVTVDARNPSGK